VPDIVNHNVTHAMPVLDRNLGDAIVAELEKVSKYWHRVRN